MSIYQVSKADLVGWVNKKAGMTFAEADLIFSPPIVNPDPVPVKNTRIRVTVAASRAGYQGTAVVDYDRLSLANLANFPVPDFPPTGGIGQSVYDLLGRIKSSTGISFTTDDLVDTQVEEGGTNGKVLLKAKPTSLGWTGEFYLLLGAKPQFSKLFKSNAINWS